MSIQSTISSCVVTAATSAKDDPVIKAARIFGFRAVKVKPHRFTLVLMSGAPVFSMPTFFEALNSELKKIKQSGDKLFSRPRYDDNYVISAARFNDVQYTAEVGAGAIIFTKTLLRSKANKK